MRQLQLSPREDGVMPTALPWLDVQTTCALGIGGALLGLVGVLVGPVVRGCGGRVATGVLAAGWAVGLPAALIFQLEPVWWLPPLALLTVTRAFAALRTPCLERLALAGLRVARHPRVHAALLLILSSLSLAGYAYYLDRKLSPEDSDAILKTVDSVVTLEEQATHWAMTDAGRSVPLFTATPESEADGRRPDETTYLRDHHFQLSVICNEPKTDASNCHGWVFTGGRYWLRGAAVEPVLEDNGYSPVQTPALGDLALYRDENGTIAHSGVVCGFTSKHEVLVESKWGRLGRYIHRADQHAYANTTCTYYHSPRAGHLLRGLVPPANGGEPKPVE
jgi:hypothetical protein